LFPFLQSLIYITADASSDEEDSPQSPKIGNKASQNESSSDDNDSTAAAHAAAIGHSPVALKATAIPASSIPSLPEEIKANFLLKTADESVTESGPANASEDRQPDAAHTDGKSDESPSAEAPVNLEVNLKPKSRPSTEEKVVSPTTAEIPTSKTGPQPMDVDDTPAPKANGDGGGEACTENVQSSGPADVPRTVKKMEVNRDINLNERDEDENVAIHVAIHARKLEHVKILLEAGASFRMRSDGSLPIHTAISIGALAPHRQFAYECVVLLHEHGADLSIKDDAVHTPLFLACRSNLPQVVSYILSDEDGLATLNTRADRAGNRPLHAAAKYDTLDNPSLSSKATGQASVVSHHHPDGSIVNAMHHIPGVAEKHPAAPAPEASEPSAPTHSTEALLTQVLLGTNGIEVDALNVLGQTPLHIACQRRNWPVARLLLHAGASPTIEDRRGFTPGQLAYKRGMPIPIDLVGTLGHPPEKGIIAPVRELIVDPDGATLLLCHELCMLHRTCPPINRDSPEPPPENVRRLHVLVDPETGILRSGEFGSLTWKGEARRAAIGDVLKVSVRRFLDELCVSLCKITNSFHFFLSRCTSIHTSSASV